MKARTPAWMALAALLASGCEVGPKSGAGLRLPDGDVGRGEIAFRELGCDRCHDVAGLAPPEGERPDPVVVIGGTVSRVETYGELVTSIVNPSHELSRRYPAEAVSEGEGVSRMESFNDVMTVSQLLDLTTFLQSKYELRPEAEFIP